MLKFISLGSGSSGQLLLSFTEKDSLIIDAGVGIRTLKETFQELRTAFGGCKPFTNYS